MNDQQEKECQCFKHYCRSCHAMHYIRRAESGAAYPRCCNKAMAYLGIVDAIPGRDESLMKKPA